jgi:hypothetical protein
LKNAPRHSNGRSVNILLVLIVFQGLGWLLAWQAMQWQAKSAARSALFQEDSPVQTLVLQQDFFKQSSVGKGEIRLEGNLYDVRSKEYVGDSVRLVLYHDWHEQLLYSLLGGHFSRLDESAAGASEPLSMWVAQWLGLTFVAPTNPVITLAERIPEKPFFTWKGGYSFEFAAPPFTPPKIVFVVA